jgi:hypothetical protein
MGPKEIRWSGTDCSDMAQDREQWRAVVNMLIKFRFHKFLGVLE